MKQEYYFNVQDAKVYALQMDGARPLRQLGPIAHADLAKDPATLVFEGDVQPIDIVHFVRLCDDEKKRLMDGKVRRGVRVDKRAPVLANQFNTADKRAAGE